MTYNKILKITIILCGFFIPTSALLAKDKLIVKTETGNCNTVSFQDAKSPTTKTSECNTSPNNTHNASNIKNPVSKATSEAIDHVEATYPKETPTKR